MPLGNRRWWVLGAVLAVASASGPVQAQPAQSPTALLRRPHATASSIRNGPGARKHDAPATPRRPASVSSALRSLMATAAPTPTEPALVASPSSLLKLLKMQGGGGGVRERNIFESVTTGLKIPLEPGIERFVEYLMKS